MKIFLSRLHLYIALMVVVAPPTTAFSADWPCWRGPNHNGITSEADWCWEWGTNGPPVLWRGKVGRGFSSFAIANNRVYTLGNTDKTDTIFCFDAATGEVLWKHSYSCDPQPLSYEGGPSATPAVHGGCVYTFSKEGHVFCLDAETGKVIWSRQYEVWPQQAGDWPNTWRYAGSPLVLSGRLVLSMGQAGRALDPKDGTLLWESPAGHPGYSSPVPFQSSAEEELAFFSGHAVLAVEARTGRQIWRIPWQTLWDLNAADPIIDGSRMFVSSGNGVGCALFDLDANPPRELWRNKNLKTLMNSPVLWRGFLFGFNDTDLSCLSWETGEVKWRTREVRKGSLVLAGTKLILLSETGKLVVAEPTERSYEPLAQGQILQGRCWTTPVLSGKRIFARNAEGDVVCLDASSRGIDQGR